MLLQFSTDICVTKKSLSPVIKLVSPQYFSLNIERFSIHDDVIKWKQFPRYWPFVRGIHRSPVNSRHKGQWGGALMFSLIYARINSWVNNREAGDLRRHPTHCDVIVMIHIMLGHTWMAWYASTIPAASSSWLQIPRYPIGIRPSATTTLTPLLLWCLMTKLPSNL